MKLLSALLVGGFIINSTVVCANDEEYYEDSGDAPQSAAWKDPERAFYRVCIHLLKVSGIREPVECKYTERMRSIEDSPALAAPPTYPGNPTGKWVVLAGYGLFEIARNEDELAAILSHEVSHIASGHSQERAELFADKCIAWYEAKRSKNPDWDLRDNELIEHCSRQSEIKQAFNKLAREQENEADVEGMNLMTAAGYDPSMAPDAMRHLGDWAWATLDQKKLRRQMMMKLLDEEKGTHESPARREKRLKRLQQDFFPSR